MSKEHEHPMNILCREHMELRGLGDSQRLVVTKEQFERFSKIGVSPCNMTVQEKIPLKGD